MTNFWTQRSWLSRVFLVFLILGLSLFSGIDRLFRTEFKDLEVVRAGKISVTVREILEEAERLMRFSGKRPLQANDVITTVIQNKITTSLLRQEIQRLGLKVSLPSTQTWITQVPSFQNPDKSFSPQKFKDFLKRVGLSEQEFIQDRQVNLEQEQLLRALLNQPTLPAAVISTLEKGVAQHRKGKACFFPALSEQISGQPSEAAYHEIFLKHRDAFLSPGQISFAMIVVMDKDIQPEKLSPRHVTERYRDYKKRFPKSPLDQRAFKLSLDRESIKNQAAQRQAALTQALEESDDLESVAQAVGVELRRVVATEQGKELSFSADFIKKWPSEAQKMLIKALKTPGGLPEMSVIECGHGIRVICDNLRTSPPQRLSFSQARPQIFTLWQREQRRQKAHNRAQQALKNVRGLVFKPLEISLKNPIVSGDIRMYLLDMSLGERRLIRVEDGCYILELTKIIDGPPLSQDFQTRLYDYQVRLAKEDFLQAYLQELRRYYPIKINEDVVKKLIVAIASSLKSSYTPLS